ncbi:acylamino-acid-releasing enzyme-like [Leptopilina boulardi]|uniref:acylamino-acid-releasing enzyme-like n=1 Tax=Leptopilina boulardi TaxID=63433 RepID=UPI0021F55C31|nr:acylamino-acid-releasing enzyme-like [Leptopilina boulardi]XP_051153692.1 acylamino-acid-releasing enzyme-like [Leptopilina boulardi]
MASSQIDKVLDIYKILSQNPTITKARITSIARNGITIQSHWAQKNLERRSKQKFIQDFSLDAELNPLVESFPVDVSNEILSTCSEDEQYKAILRQSTVDNVAKQFIEIWDRQHLVKNYDLSVYDAHGEIYTDAEFSSFQFSPDKSKLLYIAERKLPKCEPFYCQKTREKREREIYDMEVILRGNEHVFKPHWGEQLVGKHKSVVVIVDIVEDTIKINPFIPDEYFVGQVTWTPNGEYLVGVAWKCEARYLGLYACTNRASCIFLLKTAEFRKISTDGCCARSPRFSPDGKTLVWLERDLESTHHSCQRLMRVKWETDEKTDALIDIVPNCISIAHDKKFCGLYTRSLPRRCFSNDSMYVFLSSPQQYNVKSYMVNLETKNLIEVQNDDSSLTVLDVRKNRVVLMKTSLTEPPRLVVGRFDPSVDAAELPNLHLLEITKPLIMPEGMENLIIENTDYTYNSKEEVKEFNYTYFGKKNTEDKSMPWILMLHGGPHSSYDNHFSIETCILAILGFGIVRVNYRGSTGMGKKNIEYLQGRIGEVDVLDCITATHDALKKYPWLDPNYIGLCGGSHGGFLVAHLSSQYPDLYRAVVSRNPVIDIAAMYTISDIPDWCAAQTGTPFLQTLPPTTMETKYSEIYLKMFNHSPIIHADKVKAPTLLLLGRNDIRVPIFQGKLWYNRLIANKVKTKMLIYEDNHSLSSDPVEMDSVINSVLWMLENNSTFIPSEEEITVIVTAPEEEIKDEKVEETPVTSQEEKVEKEEEKKQIQKKKK